MRRRAQAGRVVSWVRGAYKPPSLGVSLVAEALKNLGFGVANPIGASCGRWGPYLTNRELAEIAHEGESPEDRAGGLGALIRSWMGEEGAGEQRETIEYLVRALDEDRLSDRKLFPRELKGKSW